MDPSVMRRAFAVAAALATLAVAAPAAATPGPPSAPEYWFDSWRVESLWATGARGQGVTIAEIDTGVNADVPELAGRVLKGKDFGVAGDGRTDRELDAFGHGTAMASIMVARPGLLDITGLAPDAKILPIAVPLRGTTDADRPDRLPDAIRYAADHHAKIISMSLGGKRSPQYDTQPCSDEEQSAIFYALRKGAMVLASVGNSGPTKNTVEDPGVCLGVVSVGAVDASGTVARFSSRQPYLTMLAPGVTIPSLGRVLGQAYSGDGTSQATAIASAAAALVWSKYPSLSAEQVVTRILMTLDDRRSKPSQAYGYGLLDAYRAVTESVPAGARNPVYSAVAPFIARSAQQTKANAAKPPAPAATAGPPPGSYTVGTAPRITGRVVAGLWSGGVGAVLLLMLLVVGLRGRRRRRDLAAVQGSAAGEVSSPGWLPWPPPPGSEPSTMPVEPEPPGGEAETRRPRPGPRPPGSL
jgi:subtilisin family serine protease